MTDLLDDTPDRRRERATCNYEAAQRVAGVELARERDLAFSKWFDYRFLTPLEATQRFATEYVKAYRAAWGTNFGRDEARSKQAIAGGSRLTNQKEFTAFWRARGDVPEIVSILVEDPSRRRTCVIGSCGLSRRAARSGERRCALM